MSKKIFLIILSLAILILGGIGLFLFPKQEKVKIENTSNSKINETDKTSSNESNQSIKNDKLVLIGNMKKNYCDKGYYYISNEDESSNIKYFDYSAKKEIYLCNKPNCKHNTKECSSYLDSSETYEMFVYKDYIYLISASGSTQTFSATISDSGETVMEQGTNTPKIYRMNLDGTNKTKLFECPTGTEIDSTYILEGNNLYTFFLKSKSVETGKNAITSVETGRTLVKINLSSGKYEELFDSKDRSIIGVYKNNIVFEEIVYKENPDDYSNDDKGYINNYNKSTKKINLFNLSTNSETEIYKDICKNMEDIQSANGKVYYIGSKGKKIEYIDLETKQKQTLVNLTKTGASINGIHDNKLQYLYYSGNEGKVSKAYYIDLETKENKEFKLLDKNKYLINILAQNDKYYFVEKGYEFGKEYTTWAGTKQKDIEKTNYALIRKEDYWNSNPKYIDMKNTK